MTDDRREQGGRPQRWSVAVYTGDSPVALGPPAGVSNPVLTADDVSDLAAAFLADPFLVREGGRWFLFFEVMPAGVERGVIGLAESDDGLRWSYRGVVLSEPFHLSYPHVFRWGGAYYMTPETLEPGQVRLYRAARFPDRWEHAADLIPGRHADPTPFPAAGAWWMFTCPSPESFDALRLYRAETPLGPWREHPRSPVVEGDARTARPAGRVVTWRGAPVRFAQDCETDYGRLVRAFRVTALSATDYREEPAAPGPVVGPGREVWNRRGMHHVDAHERPGGGWIAAVDGH